MTMKSDAVMASAIEKMRAKFGAFSERVAELEAENAELERIVSAQAAKIESMQDDCARLDRLSEIRRFGKPGTWSTVLLALRDFGDGKTLREAIDAATKGEK